MRHILFLSIGLLFSSCQIANSQPKAKTTNINSDVSYWNDGLAEINRYELKQYRYGEIRTGDLVQIFVPEDFLLNKQVKNESYESKNSTRVLKRIETRQFKTGIYEYNMFSSAFTPIDFIRHPHTIKVSSSSQEWCGNTYSQLNKINNGYELSLHSYFENEADRKTKISEAITEEELFTKIRLSPSSLPQGTINFIPSQIVSRFLHLDSKSYSSNVKLQDYTGNDFSGEELMSYTINTDELNRTVEIVFEKKSPHTIVGWTDAYSTYFNKEKRKTLVRLTHQVKEAYWKFNKNDNEKMRSELGL